MRLPALNNQFRARAAFSTSERSSKTWRRVVQMLFRASSFPPGTDPHRTESDIPFLGLDRMPGIFLWWLLFCFIVCRACFSESRQDQITPPDMPTILLHPSPTASAPEEAQELANDIPEALLVHADGLFSLPRICRNLRWCQTSRMLEQILQKNPSP